METKVKSMATFQESNYIIPQETGLHSDESKVLMKKGESRKLLHNYAQKEDLCSLTNVGQCTLIMKAMRGQMGYSGITLRQDR